MEVLGREKIELVSSTFKSNLGNGGIGWFNLIDSAEHSKLFWAKATNLKAT